MEEMYVLLNIQPEVRNFLKKIVFNTNMKMGFNEVGWLGMKWIVLAQNRDKL